MSMDMGAMLAMNMGLCSDMVTAQAGLELPAAHWRRLRPRCRDVFCAVARLELCSRRNGTCKMREKYDFFSLSGAFLTCDNPT